MNTAFFLPAFLKRALVHYRTETGRSLGLWVFIALANLLTQIILRRELNIGEFGMFNSALGVVGLMCVPLIAVDQTFVWHGLYDQGADRKEKLAAILAVAPIVTEAFTWVWGVFSVAFLLITLPFLDFSRTSMHLFIVVTVLVALGGVLSGAVCRAGNRLRLWAGLVLAATALRLILASIAGWMEPWAEAGLGAFLVAGLVMSIPALTHSTVEESRQLEALKTVRDRRFLVDLGATLCVVMAIFLFSSADRFVSQSWFGYSRAVLVDPTPPGGGHEGYLVRFEVNDMRLFDAYQTAGLLARSLLWGTQPLLLLFFYARLRLNRSTAASLHWFWVYVSVLIGGAILLELLRTPVSWLFCGDDYAMTAHLLPTLTMAMIPLGLLQGLGVFSLASRRYPECFVLGASSLGYLLLLYLAGRQEQLMPAYMFGGGLVSLMILLFVGVVRWGRKQP